MWHSLATTSAWILASTIALSPTALAQNVDINFSGNVPIQTNFTNVVPGTAETATVGTSGNSSYIIESVTPTNVSIESNSPGTMTVSPPRLLSGPTPDPDGTRHVTFLNFGTQNVIADATNEIVNIPAGITDLEIKIRVERPTPFVAGTYDYGVTITLTP
ncbi:MAG: hypothetical protein F6K47_31255 [Symploca sp. SIO2E6]|nr:hypothetical protein [Symploca sp. SIO2E6]